MSWGVYVLGGKCPGGKCPGGKCHVLSNTSNFCWQYNIHSTEDFVRTYEYICFNEFSDFYNPNHMAMDYPPPPLFPPTTPPPPALTHKPSPPATFPITCRINNRMVHALILTYQLSILLNLSQFLDNYTLRFPESTHARATCFYFTHADPPH